MEVVSKQDLRKGIAGLVHGVLARGPRVAKWQPVFPANRPPLKDLLLGERQNRAIDEVALLPAVHVPGLQRKSHGLPFFPERLRASHRV